IFINKIELSLFTGCHIIRKHRAFLDTCRLTKPNPNPLKKIIPTHITLVSSSSYSCYLPHEISRNFNRRSISVFCSSTDSVDLTTKPDLEDEGASRNEESTEENNVEFVEQAMIDEASDFQRKIMRDSDDLNWRWKPDGCDLPWSNQDFIKKLSIPPPGLKYLYFRTKYSQPFLTQTKACFLKQYWSNWRHP
ncbi:unnamed protein product, partial [Brassica oleracea]